MSDPRGARTPLLAPSTLELLAPARDLACGRTAIDCGADAVYLGAPRFGARAAAGNRIEDIAQLAAYAHQFWARVYVTVNTLLYDDELPTAERLIREVYEAGADALIIQDVGLLECDLPPLPLIASTQMHNDRPEKIAFLEGVGFHRAILARELTLPEIQAIRTVAPTIELESFVHGALCVCYSGQCVLSYACGGRSANRGECAQPCRKPYRLTDASGRVVAERGHLLSLRDLCLSEHLPALIQAGVTSFKIEGRLKDRAYVANTVAHYRARLDAATAGTPWRRSSSGTSRPGFTPDLGKTFNRGYTTYFLAGQFGTMGAHATPKMVGEPIGVVTGVRGATVRLSPPPATSAGPAMPVLHPGDGLCFFDAAGELRGTVVNAAQGVEVTVQHSSGMRVGTLLHRNHDHVFLAEVETARPERRIGVRFTMTAGPDAVVLHVVDEDGISVERTLSGRPEPARRPAEARATAERQLHRTGESAYRCAAVELGGAIVPFLPVSVLNALRRDTLEALTRARAEQRPRGRGGVLADDLSYPSASLTYLGNVLNRKAEAFYRRHGVVEIEPAAESGLNMRGRAAMTTRYCLRRELDLCAGDGQEADPLFLLDDGGRRLRLEFDCSRCEMRVSVE